MSDGGARRGGELRTIAAWRQELSGGAARREALLGDCRAAMAEHAQLNAIQSQINKDEALRAAAQAQGKLAGIPFVAKDNINTTALPTSGGTPALRANTPASNAPALDRLLAEGGVLVGKAAMHELAFGITSNNAAMGAVKNPHDPGRIPGGSSGGTAAAIAAGIVPFGLGTDTGGSCRIPAALCGVVGFRPSTGRYSAEGVIPISHTRDTIGPLANSVADIALLDSILAGSNNTVQKLQPTSIKLGVDSSVLSQNLEPEVETCFNATLERLRQAGVSVVSVDLNAIWQHNSAFSFPVVLYEVMRDLPAYLAQHAPAVSFEQLIAGIKSPDVLGIINSQLGDQAMPQVAYAAALSEHLPKMRAIYAQALAGLGAIVFPTTPLRATRIGDDETVMLNGESVPTFPTFIRNTDLGSNLGVPGISLPAAVAPGALPIGIELDGQRGQDERLLALALTLEHLISKP